ncbi:MAG: ammonia-forming cytochrome c nitrite reductase subunit c552 [Anaerolineales bacterium]
MLVGIVGLLLVGASARPAQAAPLAQDASPTPAASVQVIASDDECIACHGSPDQTMALAGGEQLYITIDKDGVAASVHGENNVGCRDCHTDIKEFPHPALAAQNLRQVADTFSKSCTACHEQEASRVNDSIHAQLRAQGKEDTAVCSDCHNPHYEPIAKARSEVVATCGRCHSGIAQEYQASVHGQALLKDDNPDVPVCIDCHGVHLIHDPRTSQFVLLSPQLCARCHADEKLMAPYHLNTNVLSTYVADFHGTTVTLFRQQTPDQLPNKPVCIDCHGTHNIKSVTDASSTVIKENLLATCQNCHPGATANFPGAWLSHYTPSPEHNALVYYVGLFYKYFVPTIVGGFAVFVVSDAGRRVVNKAKGRKPKAAPEAPVSAVAQTPAALPPTPPASAAPPATPPPTEPIAPPAAIPPVPPPPTEPVAPPPAVPPPDEPPPADAPPAAPTDSAA